MFRLSLQPTRYGAAGGTMAISRAKPHAAGLRSRANLKTVLAPGVCLGAKGQPECVAVGNTMMLLMKRSPAQGGSTSSFAHSSTVVTIWLPRFDSVEVASDVSCTNISRTAETPAHLDVATAEAEMRPTAQTVTQHQIPLRGCRKSRRSPRSTPQALKRRHIFNDLTARLKSCPSQNPRGNQRV